MKKMKSRFARRMVLGITVLGAVAAAVLPSLAVPAFATGAIPGNYRGSGSDVTFHVMNALDTLYAQSPGCTTIYPSGQPYDFSCLQPDPPGTVTTENYAHDQFHEAYPIGGSAGVTQFCNQGTTGYAQIDYARTTSGPSSTNCTGLRFVAYGRDALDWEAFPGVTGSATASMHNTDPLCTAITGLCLTQTQLQGIFINCTITNWNQVGGANAPIAIYTILPQYATRKAWDTFLGGDSSHCIPANQQATHIIDQTDNAAIIANGDQATAIAPVSWGSWNERYATRTGGSGLGAIDGVKATSKTVQNGSFPFGRYIYNVYCAGDVVTGKCGGASPSPAAVVNYIGENGWLCKLANKHTVDPISGVNYQTEIQNTIKTFGFIGNTKGPIGGGAVGSDFCRLFTT